jgi:hypothetical protein
MAKFQKGNQLGKGPNSGVPKVYTKEYIDALIPDLLAWAKTDDAIIFNEWICTRGFHQQRCSEFCQVSTEFAEAYKQSKLMVGMRREKLAMQGKVSEGMVKLLHHNYDPEHFQSLIDLKKASQVDNAQPTTVNVVLSGRQQAKVKTKTGNKALKGKSSQANKK